ncbi:MAG TPA: glycosyltransferase [Xanthobacteraceae bacterium]|jgi:glycosyltransferase involved in cell wall biosynthesis
MTNDQLLLSIVIPAYNASNTVAVTLRSVLGGQPLAGGCEVIVVDDGSADAQALRQVLAAFPTVRLLTHEKNRGSCAARNTAIAASRGAFVIILDADDWFVPDWAARFEAIRKRLPPAANVCFSACRTPDGRSTVHKPDYEGWLDARAYVRDIYGGEHLPMFRGDYVRARPYVELKSCGSLSYLRWVQDGPFYVVPDVLRIYDDRSPGSLTNTFLRRERAAESLSCLEQELARYSDLYQAHWPIAVPQKLLRLAVYARLAGDGRAWSFFRRGASLRLPLQTLGSLLMLIGGARTTATIVRLSKQLGLVKRYG